MSTRVPLEVWYLVADNLRQVELPPLLLVSRIHRLVALKRLFCHLRIFFAYPHSGSTPYALREVPRDKTMSLAWDMLSRVRCDKTFASVVQRITIYYSTEELRDIDHFHNGIIVEALKALTNLRSFSWVGNASPLMGILQKLPACCPKLQDISISIDETIPLEHSSPPPSVLNSILYVYDPTARWEYFSHLHSSHVLDLVETSESIFRSLAIWPEPLWRMPIRVFENLSRLEIFLAQDMENTTLIFRYAERLEHLSVLGLDGHAIFSLFEDYPDSLPSLRSFKILSPYRKWKPDVDIEESQMLSMTRFLRGKKLRALDIHLWPRGWSSLEPFWNLLKQLPSLEVLGITTGSMEFSRDAFLSFAKALPPGLSGLRLNVEWDIEGENSLSFIKALDRVSFFYMRNFGLIFLSDELVQELPSVKILGLDDVMLYIHRYGDNVIQVENWSARRCFTRGVEDFDGNEDWEWLMRYHDLEE